MKEHYDFPEQGRALEELRSLAHLSQKELASRSHMSHSTYQFLKKDRTCGSVSIGG